jgi:hypothetical protein
MPVGVKAGIASALASALVKSFLQPFDTVKTMQQVQPIGAKLTALATAREVLSNIFDTSAYFKLRVINKILLTSLLIRLFYNEAFSVYGVAHSLQSLVLALRLPCTLVCTLVSSDGC